MAQFYIVQKSNWQGDTWKPIAGPFPTRGEAEAEVTTYEYHHTGPLGLDLKSQKHAKAVSRTELTKLGYSRSPAGQGRLAADLCAHKENWLDFITANEITWHDKAWLSLRQASNRWGIPIATLRYHVVRGHIKARKPDKRTWLIDATDLTRWLSERSE